jgi:hypothetical protein
MRWCESSRGWKETSDDTAQPRHKRWCATAKKVCSAFFLPDLFRRCPSVAPMQMQTAIFMALYSVARRRLAPSGGRVCGGQQFLDSDATIMNVGKVMAVETRTIPLRTTCDLSTLTFSSA